MDTSESATGRQLPRREHIIKAVVVVIYCCTTLYDLIAPFAGWPIMFTSTAERALQNARFTFWVVISLFGLLLYVIFPKRRGEDRQPLFQGYAYALMLVCFLCEMREAGWGAMFCMMYFWRLKRNSFSKA